MSIVPLPLPPDAEARALLHHVLEHGDVVGQDPVAGWPSGWRWTDWTINQLMGFEAEASDFEDRCRRRG
jgi:hypothetical protein